MSIDGADVLVVGGGPGGLTAALLLADAGASVTLLERVAEPAAVGAGILLQANGLAVLAGLGLGESLDKAGQRLRGGSVRSARGAPIVEFAAPNFGPGLDHVVAIRRSRLHEILLDAVRARPAIVTRFGAEVVGAERAGAVELRWHDRSSVITGDLVVGADGVGSVVRACGDFGARVRPTGARYIRGLVPGGSLDGEYWTPLGLFGGAPVDGATTYFYANATAPPVAAALAQRNLPALRRLWAAAVPVADPILAAVSAFDDLLVNDVVRVDCPRWTDGRLVLLGDAAHAMAPTLGQGANSAMVDAAVLVTELAADGSIADALARYTARRRTAVRKVQDRADLLARLSSLANPALCALRNAGIRMLSRFSAAGLTHMVQQEDPARLHEAVRRLVDQN